MSYHFCEVMFLDVTVLPGEEGAIQTCLFQKPTAGNSILYASSFHPRPLITFIPFSQYLRTRQNCSDEKIFQLEVKILQARLLVRGYLKSCLKKAYRRAVEKTRCELLYGQKKDKKSAEVTRIVVKYSNQHTQIQNVIQKYWHLLSMDPNIGRFVSHNPFITFRRATSIRNYIVRSKFKGTYTCGDCSFCQYIHTGPTCRLPNGRVFRAQHFSNCKTHGVVYLLLCDCGLFYVGKTKIELHSRMSKHIWSMKVCNPDLPLGRHVTTLHNGLFPKIKFLALDRINPNLRGGDWNKVFSLESAYSREN